VLGDNSTHPAIALVRPAISADASNGFLKRKNAPLASTRTCKSQRPLAESDDRNLFDCGRESLNIRRRFWPVIAGLRPEIRAARP
jgi:hypothetical protein